MRSKSILVVVIVCVMAVANIALATIVQGIDIDFVTIGNASNSGDTRAEANPTGCGAVAYNYQIGKYEVTNTQWSAFITLSGGAPTSNPADAYDGDVMWTYLTSGEYIETVIVSEHLAFIVS